MTKAAGESCDIVFRYSADCLQSMSALEHLTTADRYKLHGVAGLLSYLQAFIGYGPERYDREYIERAAVVLGRSPATVAEANGALCSHARTIGASAARPLVEFFAWSYAREHSIMRTSLGKLADNTIRL